MVVPYLKGWSFDITTKALLDHLSHRFEFCITYTSDIEARGHAGIADWNPDCVVDLWWHGTLHHTFGRKVLKQISSHRWTQARWNRMKPSRLLQVYADDVGGVVVPSRRLLEILHDVQTDPARLPPPRQIFLAQKGYDPSLLEDRRMRGGPLAVGWAGASEAADKNVSTLVEAFQSIRLADRCLTYSEMGDFYNSVDVVAISSTAEGDPRPLIEGMACGCFPVSTDVGIVPELVRNGENGIIVADRTPAAFREAFEWCAANIEFVRAAGRRNAEVMRATRTWAHVMPSWGDAIDAAIRRSLEPPTPKPVVEQPARQPEREPKPRRPTIEESWTVPLRERIHGRR